MSWIQSLNPGIRYVDLETDRGRSRPSGPSSIYDNDFDPGPVSDPEPFDASDSEEEEQRPTAQQGQQKSGKKSGNGIHIL